MAVTEPSTQFGVLHSRDASVALLPCFVSKQTLSNCGTGSDRGGAAVLRERN
jgi:hypothetical protein